MTFPRTLATVFLAAALSIGGFSVLASAIGVPQSLSGQTAWADQHKGKAMCPGKRAKSGHGWHGKHGKHGHKSHNRLAQRLAAVETEIGIRADQLDDWRDYTDALQAMMKRPARAEITASNTGEPFARIDGMADRMIARAEAAEKVKAAITKLKTTLTQEQLDKVTAIGERFQARMAKIHGWRHSGKHGGKACGAKKAMPAAPEAQPDDSPANSDASSDDGQDT